MQFATWKAWWLTGCGDLHVGDRVAIWKYKGADDRRGIIGARIVR
jgi:hypothetical protein